MKVPWRTVSAFGAIVAVFIVSAFSYHLGFTTGEIRGREDVCRSIDWNGSKAQTNDAMQRWMRKTAPREMTGRYPCVTFFPDRNCIQLRLPPGWAGGEPTYCYRANTLELVEEDSDVE